MPAPWNTPYSTQAWAPVSSDSRPASTPASRPSVTRSMGRRCPRWAFVPREPRGRRLGGEEVEQPAEHELEACELVPVGGVGFLTRSQRMTLDRLTPSARYSGLAPQVGGQCPELVSRGHGVPCPLELHRQGQ